MAINDIGEQAMAAQKAREAVIRRVQQQTLPVSNQAARATGNAAAGIADRIPQGPATQPPSPDLQSQGANIASRPAVGPASSIASQKPVMQNPVDRDFAQARAEQDARFSEPKPGAARPAASAAPAAKTAPAASSRIGAAANTIRGIGEIPVGQAAKNVASAIPGAARSVVSGASKFAKGSAVVAPVAGTIQTFMQPDTAQRDFEESVGVESPVGAAVAGVGRLATNIGNAVTFGQAEKVGRGLSSLATGGGFMEGYSQPNTADRADANVASSQPAAQSQPSQQGAQAPGIADIPQQGGPSARDQIDHVMGTFNGQPLRKSDLAAKAETIGLVGGGSQPAGAQSIGQIPGEASRITKEILGRMGQQDAAFTNMVSGNMRRNDDRAAQSAERMASLKGALDTALFQGKRRTAAVIAQAMQAESDLLAGLSGKPVQDTRRNMPIDPNAAAMDAKLAAEAGAAEAGANKDRVETSRQQRINDVMGRFLDDPSSEAGQQAARTLQTINGKQNDRLYPVDVQVGADATGAPVMGKGLFDPSSGGLQYNPANQGISGGIFEQAQAAIAGGANRDEVMKRLSEMLSAGE